MFVYPSTVLVFRPAPLEVRRFVSPDGREKQVGSGGGENRLLTPCKAVTGVTRGKERRGDITGLPSSRAVQPHTKKSARTPTRYHIPVQIPDSSSQTTHQSFDGLEELGHHQRASIGDAAETYLRRVRISRRETSRGSFSRVEATKNDSCCSIESCAKSLKRMSAGFDTP